MELQQGPQLSELRRQRRPVVEPEQFLLGEICQHSALLVFVAVIAEHQTVHIYMYVCIWTVLSSIDSVGTNGRWPDRSAGLIIRQTALQVLQVRPAILVVSGGGRNRDDVCVL